MRPIEKLKAATEGSRELDGDIALAIGAFPAEATRRGSKEAGALGVFFEPIGGGYWEAPHYTRSIDAALMLAPKNWSWRVGNLPSGRGFADLGTQPSLQYIEGATPALALCIAALTALLTPSDCAVKEGGE